MEIKKKADQSFAPIKFILDPSALEWHGIGSHRHDELTVSNRLEDSRGQLVTAHVQMLDASHPQSGPLTFEIGWNLAPGVYRGTVEVIEPRTSNFGSVVFTLKIP